MTGRALPVARAISLAAALATSTAREASTAPAPTVPASTAVARGSSPGSEQKGVVPAFADLPTILAAVKAPGATAVLVNVWASWCDPCRQEMPALLRFYRAHRAGGLRLVLVSADDPDQRGEVTRFLAESGAADARVFIKTGDDMAFINGLEPSWSGALPASFLYDGRGRRRHFWLGPVTASELENGLRDLRNDPTTRQKRGQP